MTSRLIRALDALSQLGNVLIFNDDPNYSISGEAFRKGRCRWQAFIDFLAAPFESDHCRKAYENDVAKALVLMLDDDEQRRADPRFKTASAP